MQIIRSKIFKLDEAPIPSPSTFSVDMEDVHTPNSGRGQDAYMNLEVVYFGKRSVTIRYDLLPQDEISKLLKHFHKPYYQFTYPDPEYGTRRMTCYVPSRKSELYSMVYYNGLWREITFNCIEA